MNVRWTAKTGHSIVVAEFCVRGRHPPPKRPPNLGRFLVCYTSLYPLILRKLFAHGWLSGRSSARSLTNSVREVAERVDRGLPDLSHTAEHNSLRAHGGSCFCIGCTFRGEIWSSTQSMLGKSLVFCSAHWTRGRAKNGNGNRTLPVEPVSQSNRVRPVFGRTFEHQHTHSHLSHRTPCAALLVSRENKIHAQPVVILAGTSRVGRGDRGRPEKFGIS